MEKEDLIINLLKEGRVDQKAANEDIAEIKIDVALNRQDLEIHMQQTDIVKKIALANKEYFEARINDLEKRHTLGFMLKSMVAVASGIGVVAGAIYGVVKVVQSLS